MSAFLKHMVLHNSYDQLFRAVCECNEAASELLSTGQTMLSASTVILDKTDCHSLKTAQKRHCQTSFDAT